jgi:hypothetical protein
VKRIAVVLLLAVFLAGVAGSASAAAPAGAVRVKLKGDLEVLVAEDFERGIAKKLYRLKERRSGKIYELKADAELPADLKTGDVVLVRGKAKGRTVYLGAAGETSLVTVAASVPSVTGGQKTMIVIANFQDAAVSCTAPDIESRMFTDPLNRSVDDLYQELSFGNVWFEGGVFGPFTIPYTTTSACSIEAWAGAADAAASAAGVDVAAYTRKVYILPRTNPCGYTGIGTVGGAPSRSWIFRCELSDCVAHELGHNLGMGHASTPSNTYGDTSDIMGYSGLPLRQINAPHQKQTGWLSAGQYQPVSGSGTYAVAPLELRPTEAAAPQVLLLAKPDTGDSYFLSYRQAIGFDANLSSTYLRGVSVHQHRSGSSAQTYLMSSLADGGVFTDAVNGITITQVAHDAQSATVDIQIASGPVCTPSPPVVTLAPASQSGMPGDQRDYLVSVNNPDSPECAATTHALVPVVPAGWTGSVSPASLTLAPGAAGTAMLTVLPSTAAAAADYQVAVTSTVSGTSRSGSATAMYTVLPDMVAPTAPANLKASVGRGVIGLSWLASSDNVKVAGYQLWRNGVALQQTAGTSYSDKAIVNGATYTYTVTAYDPAGNQSGSSNTAAATAVKSGGKTRN